MSAIPVADCFLDTNILLYAVSTNPAETMNNGQDYGGVRVLNPFLPTP
jgi:hypothetical protein